MNSVSRAAAAAVWLGVASCAGPALAQTGSTPFGGEAALEGEQDRVRKGFEALPEADRIAIQDALVWTGDYNTAPDGAWGRRTFEALQAYGKRTNRGTAALLDRAGIAALVAAGGRAKAASGFAIIQDAATGIRIGIPEKLLTRRGPNPNGGSRLQSADGKVTLDTRALPGDEDDLKEMYERNLAVVTPGRHITYKAHRPEFFVVSGDTQNGRFYIRSAARDGQIRGFSLGYDKAQAPDLDRVAIAIANSFVPFPTGPAPAGPAAPPLAAGDGPPTPPARAAASAANFTGLTLGPRRVLAPSAALDACREPQIGAAPARIVSADRERGLAILEPASAQKTGPVVLGSAAPSGAALALFIASGEGGTVLATPAEIGPNPGRLTAPLQEGGAGAIVVDRSGQVIGMVRSLAARPRAVAGLVPPASYPFAGPDDIREASRQHLPAGLPAAPGSFGGAAAALGPALVRITCGRAAP